MDYLKDLAARSWRTGLILLKIMLPVMILMRLLDEFGFSQFLGDVLGPAMTLFGLPSETGLIWAVSLLVGLYAGLGALIATLPGMDLTVAQMSVFASMLLFAHMLPTEQAIVHRAGASFWLTSLLRILAAIIYGFLANLVLTEFALLQEPLVLEWTPDGFASDSWYDWSIATAQSVVMMFIIIVALFLILDLFEKIGINAILMRILSPLHYILGIRKELAPITTAGLLMGLAYGGGAIIEYVEKNPISRRDLFLTLSFLSIFHAVIEDTLLLLAFGADIWVILVGRGLFSVLFIMILGRLMLFARAPDIKAAE